VEELSPSVVVVWSPSPAGVEVVVVASEVDGAEKLSFVADVPQATATRARTRRRAMRFMRSGL